MTNRQAKQNFTVVSVDATGTQRQILTRFLDTNGDGTGTKSAVGDYSVTPDIFYIQPPAGEVYRIARLIPQIEDSGTFDSGSYGNGITLTNGVSIRVSDDTGVTTDLLDGLTIKTNTHWARYCFDISLSTFGLGNEFLNARWTFQKSGQYIRLDGDNNERLEVLLNDDFTGLVGHYFMVQGYIERSNE